MINNPTLSHSGSTQNKPNQADDLLVADRLFEVRQPTPPAKYKVILNNDDYTPMDFVVHVLMHFFAHDAETAQEIMLKVHFEQKAVCGVYVAEIAESKAAQVNSYARKHQHPLLCTLEKENT